MPDSACYKNRELSWLQFNERVLDEAGNKKVPLAERLTFAHIYQTNLDEFYMVRVGTLVMQSESEEDERDSKTHMTSKEQIESILKETKRLEKKKYAIYTELLAMLKECNIEIVNFKLVTEEETAALEEYFDEHIAPFLSPMLLSKQQPVPFLTNQQLYSAVLLSNKKGKAKIGIVPCSGVFKRLIELPTRPGVFVLAEELILHFVAKLFPKYTVRGKSIMRITRNADIEVGDVYDEELDFRNIMEHLIKQRIKMAPVRLELSREIEQEAQKELAKYFGIKNSHIVKVDTPLDLGFFSDIRTKLRAMPTLFYKKRTPRPSSMLDMRKSIIAQIEKKDILLSYPYESIKPFIKLLNEAAEDENVVSIKITLYRVADKSEIVDALVDAAENGKEVVVVIELRARFDEENNIEMSKRLEDAGCTILYGLEEYKVHSKLCLITRSINDSVSFITQVGTGNYNEKTSALYTDLSLITADKQIGLDADKVFKALLIEETPEKTTSLLVAPKTLQKSILKNIDAQIALAKEGKDAYCAFKLNSLTSVPIMEKLIEASRSGVKIDMLIRGICCLIPGIKGYTENITVVSVVGRFLEHSRIYAFGRENPTVYISSADFMTRNMTKRVEVAAPVYSEVLKQKIMHIFETCFNDDEKGKQLHPDGMYYSREINKKPLNSQEKLYDEAYKA